MVIDFQTPRTNQELQKILIDNYINRDGNEMSWIIVGQQDSDKMHQTFIG